MFPFFYSLPSLTNQRASEELRTNILQKEGEGLEWGKDWRGKEKETERVLVLLSLESMT